MHVLYDKDKGVALRHEQVCGAPIPLNTSYSETTYPSLVSLENTVLECFDQSYKRDVQDAMANGFSKACFVTGRGAVYERQCYDGAGDEETRELSDQLQVKSRREKT